MTPGPSRRTPKLNMAVAKLQMELPEIAKGETGEVKGTTKDGRPYSYEYKYADLADISKEIMPLLGKHGLAFTAFPTIHDGHLAPQWAGKLVLEYSLMHESGEERPGVWPLHGGTPQAVGSEITYMRRYCLCAATGVAPVGADDDGSSAEQAARTRGSSGSGRDESWRDSPPVNRAAATANGQQPKPDEPPAAEPETDMGWMAHMCDELIPAAANRDELANLWANVAEHKKAGTCTEENAAQIGAFIKGRNDELTGAPA